MICQKHYGAAQRAESEPAADVLLLSLAVRRCWTKGGGAAERYVLHLNLLGTCFCTKTELR